MDAAVERYVQRREEDLVYDVVIEAYFPNGTKAKNTDGTRTIFGPFTRGEAAQCMIALAGRENCYSAERVVRPDDT